MGPTIGHRLAVLLAHFGLLPVSLVFSFGDDLEVSLAIRDSHSLRDTATPSKSYHEPSTMPFGILLPYRRESSEKNRTRLGSTKQSSP